MSLDRRSPRRIFSVIVPKPKEGVYSISGSFVAATGRRTGPLRLPTVLDIP
jgi:hypothetical protein